MRSMSARLSATAWVLAVAGVAVITVHGQDDGGARPEAGATTVVAPSTAAGQQRLENIALAAMEGTWELCGTSLDGTPQAEEYEYRRWRFDGRALRSEYKTLAGQEHQSDLTVTVNPAADPPEMNVYSDGVLLLAIYRQDGDRMKVAILGRSEVERPRGFDPGDKRIRDVPLVVWELRRVE